MRFPLTEPRECISQKEAMRRAEKELDSHGENLIGSQEENGFLRSKVDVQLQRKNSNFYEIN